MKKTQDKKVNSFHVRIYDDDLLKSVNELYGLGEFESMNELLNTALAIGAEKMYLERGRRRVLDAAKDKDSDMTNVKMDELLKRIKNIETTNDDVFVMMSAMEMLVSALYNVKTMELKGEDVSAELLDSGHLSAPPENVQQVKDSLVRRFKKKEN